MAAEAESPSAAACAPPVVCTSPVLESGVDDAAEEVPPVSADDVDDDGVFTFDEDVVAAGFSLAEDESAGLVEADDVALESVGSASATPGVVAAAHPTPSATANAPTRPTYLT